MRMLVTGCGRMLPACSGKKPCVGACTFHYCLGGAICLHRHVCLHASLSGAGLLTEVEVGVEFCGAAERLALSRSGRWCFSKGS